jgi:hypothetical protein
MAEYVSAYKDKSSLLDSFGLANVKPLLPPQMILSVFNFRS